MILKDILKIQSVIDGRRIPSDMSEIDIEYFSESKDKYIDIMDMHIIHFIRAYRKMHENQSYEIMEASKPEIVEIDGAKYRRVENAE